MTTYNFTNTVHQTINFNKNSDTLLFDFAEVARFTTVDSANGVKIISNFGTITLAGLTKADLIGNPNFIMRDGTIVPLYTGADIYIGTDGADKRPLHNKSFGVIL